MKAKRLFDKHSVPIHSLQLEGGPTILWWGGFQRAIAELEELHEADKYDALQAQDAAWHDIEDKHLADLATAQAQVAVMTDLLESVDYYEPDWEGGDVFEISVGLETGRAIRDALSAAPKVVGRWEGKWEIHDDKLWLKIFFDGRIASCNTAPRASWDNEPSGNDMHVFIVDKQGEGE